MNVLRSGRARSTLASAPSRKSPMELRHLRYLIAVSEEATFVRAAERLHLAQPALSRQIHSLEEELGATVFERGRSGVTLTAAGAIAVDCARSLIENVNSA